MPGAETSFMPFQPLHNRIHIDPRQVLAVLLNALALLLPFLIAAFLSRLYIISRLGFHFARL